MVELAQGRDPLQLDILDPVMNAGENSFLAKRFAGAVRRDLHIQDISAVRIRGHQFFNGLNLAGTFSQAWDERVFFRFAGAHVSWDLPTPQPPGFQKRRFG
jgi:hypothetical protein